MQNIYYHVAAFCDSNKFDMEHDQDLKKLNFDTLTSSPRSGVGGCGQNICYDATAFVIPFNLICNMTMF